MKNSLSIALLVLSLLCTNVSAQTTTQRPTLNTQRPSGVSFHRDILPIFRTACLGCHSMENPASGMVLISYASLMKGGKGGQAVIPGKGGESRLVKYLTGALQPKMPPGSGLKQADIDRVRQWIDAGAKMDAQVLETTPKGTVPNSKLISKPTVRHAPTPSTGTLLPIPAPVSSLAFSPNGKSLLVGTYREVQFWSLAEGPDKKLERVWSGHADAVHALVFSNDGKWLAAGGGSPGVSGEIRLWDMTVGREARVFGDQADVVNGLAFSPDGSKIASASADKTLKIWECATGKPLAVLRDHSDSVWGVVWSKDGKLLASVSADRSLKVWDASNGKRLYSMPAHDEPVYDIELSPNGQNLMTVSGDKIAKIWNFGPESASVTKTLGGHTLGVLAAAIAPSGKLAATASADKTVKVWDESGGNMKTLTDAKDWVYAVRFSTDNKHLAAGTWDGSILLWNLPDGKLEAHLSTLHK